MSLLFNEQKMEAKGLEPLTLLAKQCSNMAKPYASETQLSARSSWRTLSKRLSCRLVSGHEGRVGGLVDSNPLAYQANALTG